jgi:hypothetical protein
LNQPHIIYILSDEHRGQAMSHTGDPNVQTPWMDRLAAEGASFSRAYANLPDLHPLARDHLQRSPRPRRPRKMGALRPR